MKNSCLFFIIIFSFSFANAVMALVGCTNGQERYETISIKVHEGTKLAFDLSPDGRTIVFDLLGQLWLLPATGGEATPLTDAVRDKSENLSPVFSPDGQQIAFESDHSLGRGLWLVSRKDGKLRRLTEQEFFHDRDWSPAWSPTGSHIAFVRGYSKDEIHILDLETDKVQLLHIEDLPDPDVVDPAWSPDGTRLCFVNAGRFKASGGRIWEVGINGETATPLTAKTVDGRAPVYSPDAKHIAFFSQDLQGQMQLWVQDLDGAAKMLTDHSDTTALRVRWSPDGSSLYYSADGQLWRIAATGGSPQAIPFTAELSFERKRSHLKPVRFTPPGVEIHARGHRGLALSPGGKRIAMIALEKLWVWRADDKPYAVATLPSTADGLAWSPNGQEVAWSAGLRGAEDLFATDVETGKTRRLTALPGLEIKPSWSPDGQHIAFVHAEKPGWTGNRLRIIPAHAAPVEQLETTLDLTEVGASWAFGFLGLGHEVPQWSPDSSALLLFDFDFQDNVVATLVPLTDEPQPLERFPTAPTFLRWRADGSIVFVQNNMLWQAQFQSDSGMVGEPLPVFDAPAFYPSISKDGSLLYISEDGLRIRRPDGRVERLGWPLSYQTLTPERLLIRDVRIIDGKEDVPTKLRDILVEGGRIARIAPAGEIRAKAGIRVIEAGGRTVIPGLIDLHTHLWDDALLPGQLYYGVTTVRDMGAAIGKLAASRDAIEAGVRIGPRIVFGGFQFWGTGGASGETGQRPDDDAGRARAISIARAFRADYVKMRWFSKWDAGARLIDHAHAAGLRVSGHCAHALPLIAAGIDGKEHLGPSCTARSDGILYEDIIQLFKAAQLWVVPTIHAFSSVARLMDDPSLIDDAERAPFLTPFLRWWVLRRLVVRPEDKQSRMAFWERSARIARLGTEKLHKEGVTIGAGSDTPSMPWALHGELQELVRSGMSPSEAIHAATGAAARVLGAEAEIGTIADGKWADLVILDADPLQDIQNTKKIWMVIKGGEIVNRDALLHWIERETARCESQEQLKP